MAASPKVKPINKVSYGGMVSLGSVALIALAKALGLTLDPVLASLIATGVYFTVAYLVPQKYQGHMAYVNQVAQLLVSMRPDLNEREVTQQLATPMANARLISSTAALDDLVLKGAGKNP